MFTRKVPRPLVNKQKAAFKSFQINSASTVSKAGLRQTSFSGFYLNKDCFLVVLLSRLLQPKAVSLPMLMRWWKE